MFPAPEESTIRIQPLDPGDLTVAEAIYGVQIAAYEQEAAEFGFIECGRHVVGSEQLELVKLCRQRLALGSAGR